MISLSLANISFSQVKISNLSLTDSTLPIAYLGVDNVLSISGLSKEMRLSINSKYTSTRLMKNGENNYIYQPSISDKYDTIFIWNKDVIIAKQHFKILILNEPKVSLGNNRDSFISISQAINSPYLSIYIPDNYFKYKMYVASFELFKIENKDTFALYSPEIQQYYDTILTIDFMTGKETFKIERKEGRIERNFNEYLTTYQLSELRKMKKGDKLLFKEITIRGGQNGCSRKLNDYQVEIK